MRAILLSSLLYSSFSCSLYFQAAAVASSHPSTFAHPSLRHLPQCTVPIRTLRRRAKTMWTPPHSRIRLVWPISMLLLSSKREKPHSSKKRRGNGDSSTSTVKKQEGERVEDLWCFVLGLLLSSHSSETHADRQRLLFRFVTSF